MEQASATLTQLLHRMQQQSAMAFTSDPKAASRELERLKAECYNREEGTLNQQDNYNCPLCRNRGKTVELVMEDGEEKAKFFECRCMNVRSTIARMQRSGRQDVISKYTLDSFLVENDFQRTLKEAAQGYLKAGTGWFFIGGQSGCGKSHIGTAIFRELLLAGKTCRYMAWREDAPRLKKLLHSEGDEYCAAVDQFKQAQVLYIDDLFKTGRESGGRFQRPTVADINLAYEILNYRADRPKLMTILSSECLLEQLIEIDEAIGGRIAELSAPYVFSISPDRTKNYRLRGMGTL